jgi:hypothetical protein
MTPRKSTSASSQAVQSTLVFKKLRHRQPTHTVVVMVVVMAVANQVADTAAGIKY